MAEEYLTAAAGPTSHSPPPIDVAAMIAPGPITAIMLRNVNTGGAGRSATSQGGSYPCSGGSIRSAPVCNTRLLHDAYRCLKTKPRAVFRRHVRRHAAERLRADRVFVSDLQQRV